MTTHTITKPLTGSEFAALGDIGPAELVRGEIVPMSPTGHSHGYIEFNLARIVGNFVFNKQLGRLMGGEVGIYTQRQPDTVRAADALFISNARMAKVQSESYLDVAPELVVEIMSPDDHWSELITKLDEYFVIGVELAWVVEPRHKRVHVYRSLADVETLTKTDTLTGGDILPGLSEVVMVRTAYLVVMATIVFLERQATISFLEMQVTTTYQEEKAAIV
ncbi:MAG: Uma2 family endonuclease [Okeania sp. SIO3B3]|nr:Uma2 family endonuclease [Okeania sp. SIO3B3]